MGAQLDSALLDFVQRSDYSSVAKPKTQHEIPSQVQCNAAQRKPLFLLEEQQNYLPRCHNEPRRGSNECASDDSVTHGKFLLIIPGRNRVERSARFVAMKKVCT